jgi:alkylhydroperoxidase/carboxymuconolactone decarboxylase family protein YurZ
MSGSDAVKEKFINLHGYWNDNLQTALDADPNFFGDYLEMAGVAYGMDDLDPKTKDFVLIAANAAVTHMNPDAVAGHIASAIKHGATKPELLEVLQIASWLGIHALTEAAPVLLDVLAESEDKELKNAFPRGERYEEVKSEMIQKRDHWDDTLLDATVRVSPDFFSRYITFTASPWRKGTLSPITRQLICVAIDSSTTHLYNEGTRVHARNAIRYGATPKQVIQVVLLVSLIGMQSFTLGAPIVMQQFANAPD